MKKRPRIGVTCGLNIDKLPPYLQALEAAGAEGVVFKAAKIQASDIIATVDGWLLPGGGDIDPSFFASYTHPSVSNVDPVRDKLEIEITRMAHTQQIPLFGICRGIQIMGCALGGDLFQDIDGEAPPRGVPKHHRQAPNNRRNFLAHDIQILPRSRLAQIVGENSATVNSIHHQSVKTCPDALQIVARSSDGIIEAIEAPSHKWFIGVQWHPEEILSKGPWMKLFEDFVKNCSKRK